MEQTFRADEGVLLVEGRVLRRVIKAHRHIRGLGLGVPHVHCYAIPRDALIRLAAPEDLDPNVRHLLTRATHLRSIILVARLSNAEMARRAPADITNRLWRAAFHARIHVAIEEKMDSGALPEAALRERIDRIGQAEFDEIREMLRQDDLLLPPYQDREAYSELVALFLELRHFSPRLLHTTFPSLDIAKIEAEIARDLDAAVLLDAACPEGVDPGATIALIHAATTSAATMAPISEAASFVAPEGQNAVKLMQRAAVARAQGNRVRAALLASAVGLGKDPTVARRAKASAREDIEALGERLKAALRAPESATKKPDLEWASLLMILADEGAARSGLRYSIEARLLLDLQNAALAHENVHHSVDLVTWALSLGKRPVVRSLPTTRPLRVARLLHAAARKVKLVRIAPGDRKLIAKLLGSATLRADQNVRAELRPKLIEVLNEVGLKPTTTPETVARDKVIEELLDHAAQRGFINMGHVRDALSRNHLKLDDLGSGIELWKGDPLLRADRAFSIALDGVYRPGEVYLRGLQKLSSLLFGTPIGRAIVLYAILPIGGAFIALEGASHILAPILKPLGVHHLTLFVGGPAKSPLPAELSGFTTLSFWITVVFVFGLLHSDAFRGIVLRLLRLLGQGIGTLFVRVPKWVFSLPPIEKLIDGKPARVLARHAIVPSLFSLLVYFGFLLIAPKTDTWILLIAMIGTFAAVSVALGTRLGDRTEDLLVEHIAPTWKMLSHKVLPGVFKGIVDFFRWLMDGMERLFYRVDEALRFREGENKISLFFKAIAGTVWFGIAYLSRVYVALLIEPYVNPVKQVPMTAAAHKMMLPFAPQIIALFNVAFRPLGPLVGGPLAAVTAFFFPTIFGFFGWELKENYKLYRKSRPKELTESPIGSHGETMAGLLVAGFHSGTLPKLFARLRHSARREEEIGALSTNAEAARKTRGEGARGRFREGTQEVETALRYFIEREMLSLLMADARWPHGPLNVARIVTSANRIRITLTCPGVSKAPTSGVEISFEEQSGYVVAGVVHVGFADLLRGTARILFENVLAGIYKFGAADLVREQIEAAMGADLPYDIADDGLVVWPGPGYVVEALYPLKTHAPVIEATLRGGLPTKPLPPLDARAISFRHQPIAWSAWVYAWSAETGKEPPRLMTGPSLIPSVSASSSTAATPVPPSAWVAPQ